MDNTNAKKGNKSILVIGISFLLIIAGVVLIVTGNNKSFLNDDKSSGKESSDNSTNTDDNSDNNQDTPIDDEPNRDIVSNDLNEQDVINLIFEKKNQEFSDEQWNLGAVEIIAHDETKEKYLVQYDKIDENQNTETFQTIISILGESKDVELPGWVPGERDLSVYNFIYVNSNENLDDNNTEINDQNIENNIE